METRANYILVGAFTLAVLIGAFFFAIWLAKTSFERSYAFYNIYFEGSVAGLRKGGDVLYNGLKVGEVRDLRLAPRDPSRVRVLIRVDAGTPISEDTVASLGFQGLTGVSVVQLSGGSPEGSALPIPPGEDYPVIKSKPSTFDELLQGLPNMIAKGSDLLSRLNLMFSEENRDSLRRILHNLDAVSAQLGAGGDLGRFVHGAADAAAEFKVTANKLNGMVDQMQDLAANADSAVKNDLKPLLQDAQSMIKSVNHLAGSFDDIAKNAGPGLEHFTQTGLPEVTEAARELHQLSQTLDRFLQHMESDPGRFLWGNPNAGYQPK